MSLSGDPYERQVRAAENHAVFREVNERVRELNDGFSLVSPMGEWICECANDTCMERLTFSANEYEAVRLDQARFFVAPTFEQSSRRSGTAPLRVRSTRFERPDKTEATLDDRHRAGTDPDQTNQPVYSPPIRQKPPLARAVPAGRQWTRLGSGFADLADACRLIDS